MTERISAVALLSPNKSIKNTLHSNNIDNKTNDSEGSHTPEDPAKSVLSSPFAQNEGSRRLVVLTNQSPKVGSMTRCQVFCAILLLLVCNVLK